LNPDDAAILTDEEAATLDAASRGIREALSGQLRSTRDRTDSDWM
jgi:hypothetical protein